MLNQGLVIKIGIDIVGDLEDAVAPPPPVPNFIISEDMVLEYLVSENGFDRLITEY